MSTTWNTNFEDKPAGSRSAALGDDDIREFKSAIRERVQKEHYMNLSVGAASEDGWHLNGSAVIYSQETMPSTKPDGVTALDSDDDGRIWRKPSTGEVAYYYHAAGATTEERWQITLSGSSQISAAEGITAGQLVAIDTSGEAIVADKGSLATAYAVGVALNTVVAGEDVVVQKSGENTSFSGLISGTAYFLGDDGAVVGEGSIATFEYRVFIGVAKEADTMDLNVGFPSPDSKRVDNAPVAGLMDYFGTELPLGWEWVPYETTTKSIANYKMLHEAFGEVDWFAADAAAATAAASAGTFHMPTIRDAYVRNGFHADATFDNTDESVTLLDKNGSAVEDDWRNGTAIRFIGGTMPTGITEYTTYYLGWDTDKWLIYDTQANAETNDGSTGLVSFTTDGSGVTGTQFGITLDDQMQRITGAFNRSGTSEAILNSDALLSGAFEIGEYQPTGTSQRLTGATATDRYGLNFDSSGSPDARTSTSTDGETRPRTAHIRKIIKVSNLLPTGEPVTAVKYDTGWISNSDWTNAELTVTHNLSTDLSGLIVKFFLSSDGTEANAIELSPCPAFDYVAASRSTGFIYDHVDDNSFNVLTLANGLYVRNDVSGAVNQIDTETYYYKVVVYKPSILSSVADIQWPVGAQYTQYASVASNDAAVALPSSEAPATLFGGVWEKLWDTESVYFRTEGADADDGRTDGKQLDQMQGHVMYSGVGTNAPENGVYGSTTTDIPGVATARHDQNAGAPTHQPITSAPKPNGTDGTPRTGAETRVTGRLMRIWRRTA